MIYKGKLRSHNGSVFLETDTGERLLEGYRIWQGYIIHWRDQSVCVRMLPQKDYETHKPIIIMWPDKPKTATSFVEIYYNERLVKYSTSTFGHNAINVNGEFFNFSHLINENELMDEAEYMYRPALGEFSASPHTGKYQIMGDGTAYLDKFGRNFMRTIHVIRVEGLDTDRLAEINHHELKKIHATPPDPKEPEKYRDFNFLKRSCTTIIRDSLKKYGFSSIKGILPRDFFISAALELIKAQETFDIKVKLYKRAQLKVPEAPFSKQTPILNPINWVRSSKLPKMKKK